MIEEPADYLLGGIFVAIPLILVGAAIFAIVWRAYHSDFPTSDIESGVDEDAEEGEDLGALLGSELLDSDCDGHAPLA